MDSTETLIITARDAQEIVQRVGVDALMDDLIDRLEEAFSGYSTEKAEIPTRNGFSYNTPATGLVEWMPCMYRGDDIVIKVVGYHPSNPEKRTLPTILSTASGYDSRTGHLKYLMDATLMTALRTGAASAISTRLLARDQKATVGLIGAGAQAVTQLHALSRVLEIDRVLVYDIDPLVQASFPDRVRPFLAHSSVSPTTLLQLLPASDVICTATSIQPGAGPIFKDIEIRSWAHINAVGSDFPDKIELPLPLLERAFVVPDFRDQAIVEGECQQLGDDAVGPELFEIVQNHELARGAREKLTVFDSTGWALEDHVGLHLFVDHARKYGLGKRLKVESICHDPRNPYQFLVDSVRHSVPIS